MLGKVETERRGRVLVATVDNPPVNALSHGVRSGLVDAVAQAAADPEVGALVIRCAGRTFMSGADIREFGRPMEAPRLGEVVAAIAASAKPVVAAIHGSALGGGFEVALAAHYRIAAPDAKVGLPEVKLGIIPGAGGTQRLPRLVGLEAALDMIVEARSIAASRALEIGAIDAVAEADLTDAAVAFADARLSDPPPRAEERTVGADPELIETWRAKVASRKRGQLAPARAVEAVGWSVDLPFGEAVGREYEACIELLAGPQSRSLRHLFVAERMAAKPPRLEGVTDEREVAAVGVVGPGTMGTGIAATFVSAGIPVTLLGRSEAGLERARTAIAKMFASNVSRGRMSQAAAENSLGLVTTTQDYAALAPADLVVEAVGETLQVKQEVFVHLGAECRPGAILASNTSFLDLDRIAEASGRPAEIVGMHFFNPANVMRLVEIVGTQTSAGDALATAMAVARRIGKMPVLLGSCEGFVGNRMLAQRSREALFLLEEGARPWQIDRVFREFGFPMGPYELADLAGLDIVLATRQARFDRLPPREQACDILPRLVAEGRLGRKSGAGFYAYRDGKAEPDPSTEELIAAHASAVGIARREIADEEILERCLFAMINEGARLLEEGVVARPHEIDVVWTQGFGFPAHLGGPMFHADEIGLAAVRDRLARYANDRGVATLAPAPLLDRLAEAGDGFYDASSSARTAS